MTTTKTDNRITVEKPSESQLDEMGIKTWPIWTKEVSDFDWHYDDRETCYLLEGLVTVTTDQGEVTFGKGDLVTFARDLSCHWSVKEAVRKHYRFG